MQNNPTPAIANINGEFVMLGRLMETNSLLERIPFLEAHHFFKSGHQKIFSAISRLIKQGTEANPFTVGAIIQNEPELSDLDPRRYLMEAVSHSLGMHDPIDHAKWLCSIAQRRALYLACTNAASLLADDPESSPAEAAIKLSAEFEQVSRGFGMPRTFDDFEIGEQILEDLKSKKAPTSTGLPRLDNAMGGGLYPGKAYGFAARKKVGKTILASTISCNLNLTGVKHLFVCGEMSPKEIHQRTLARLTQSYPSAFRSDYGDSPAFQKKIADAVATTPRNIQFFNAPSLNFDDLRRVVVTAALTQGIKGFILDYWQLVGGRGKKGATEHLDEVAQWIADTCRKYDLWAIVMAQLNQEDNTRGGEGIRLAFDQVYKLDRKDVTQPYAYLEMLETRYTAWGSIGSETEPGLLMNEMGPYFEQL